MCKFLGLNIAWAEMTRILMLYSTWTKATGRKSRGSLSWWFSVKVETFGESSITATNVLHALQNTRPQTAICGICQRRTQAVHVYYRDQGVSIFLKIWSINHVLQYLLFKQCHPILLTTLTTSGSYQWKRNAMRPARLRESEKIHILCWPDVHKLSLCWVWLAFSGHICWTSERGRLSKRWLHRFCETRQDVPEHVRQPDVGVSGVLRGL